jgi:hypothetical protein
MNLNNLPDLKLWRIPYLGSSDDSRLASAEDDGSQRVSMAELDSTKDSVKDSRDIVLLSVTPTVSTTPAYSAGDAVGGKQSLVGALPFLGTAARLQQVFLMDKGNQKAAMDLLFFDQDPTAATITDNAAFAGSTAVANIIARVPIAAADYVTVAGVAYATKSGLNVELASAADTTLYVAAVTSGTPTYVSTSDLVFKYTLQLD